MNENPNYWATIATVIPVIALTSATTLRSKKWHRMRDYQRRLSAFYGAIVVGALVYAEMTALAHLMAKDTDKLDERWTVIVVAFAAANVIAAPIAPLLTIAIHDLSPTVLRIKRDIRADERRYREVVAEVKDVREVLAFVMAEAKIEASDAITRDLNLAFEDDGRVRADYAQRVGTLQRSIDFHATVMREIETNIRPKQDKIEAHLQRKRRRLNKALKNRTRNTTKQVGFTKKQS